MSLHHKLNSGNCAFKTIQFGLNKNKVTKEHLVTWIQFFGSKIRRYVPSSPDCLALDLEPIPWLLASKTVRKRMRNENVCSVTVTSSDMPCAPCAPCAPQQKFQNTMKLDVSWDQRWCAESNGWSSQWCQCWPIWQRFLVHLVFRALLFRTFFGRSSESFCQRRKDSHKSQTRDQEEHKNWTKLNRKSLTWKQAKTKKQNSVMFLAHIAPMCSQSCISAGRLVAPVGSSISLASNSSGLQQIWMDFFLCISQIWQTDWT